MTFEPGLLPWTMSVSVILTHPLSCLVTHVSTKGYTDVQGLGRSLWPHGCPRTVRQPGSCLSDWPVLLPGAKVSLLPRTISGSMALQQPGSELMFTKGRVDGLGSGQLPKTVLVCAGHAISGAILIRVTCAATGAMMMSGSKLLPRTIHVRVCGPAATGVCAAVYGLCYHKPS